MKKINSLQGLRALAFVGILLQHTSVVRLGTWGVSFFFILSGFVTVITWKEPEKITLKFSIQYALKKIKGIYPTHIVTMLGVAVLHFYSFVFVDNKPEKVWSIVKSLFVHSLLLQDWFAEEKDTLNGVSWFFSAILFMFLLTPISYKLLGKVRSPRVSWPILGGLCIAIQSLVSFALRDSESMYYVTYFFPLFRFGDYLVGMIMGFAYEKIKKREVSRNTSVKQRHMWTIMEFLAIGFTIILNVGLITGSFDKVPFLCQGIVFLPSNAVLILFLAFERGYFSKILSLTPLVFVGNISGHAFLISQCVLYYLQAIVSKFCGGFTNYWLQAALTFLVTVVASFFWIKLCKK